MGFRDLTMYNKALLAKQLWRMLSNPDLLVAKVFKARYFKHIDIMDATIGTNPSYILRFLIWSRDILQKGLYWKVGNGKSINAIRDTWIPDLPSGKITSNVSNDNNVQINSLLRSPTSWDTEKLKNLFLPYEVEAILHIPIAGSPRPDSRF